MTEETVSAAAAQEAEAQPAVTTARPGVLREGWQVAVELLRVTGRLLARYWAPLVVVSALGVIVRSALVDLAIEVVKRNAVMGYLAMTLIPAFALITVIGMLWVMGRPDGLTFRRGFNRLLAAFASAMVVFVALYEYKSELATDRRDVFGTAIREAVFAGEDTDRLLPSPTAISVISIVFVALIIRFVGGGVLKRLNRHVGASPTTRQANRQLWLRLLVGLAELVWLVIAALVLTALFKGAAAWWASRRIVVEVSTWWATLDLDALSAVLGWISHAVSVLTTSIVAGILLPMGWLTIGLLFFGSRIDQISSLSSRTAGLATRLPGIRKRDGAARLDAAKLEARIEDLTEPEGRWGVIGSSIGVILTRGWVPVLTYCALYLVASQLDYVVWSFASNALPTVAVHDWVAIYPVVGSIANVVTQVVVIALVAAAVDFTLRSVGISGVLRLPAAVEPVEQEPQPTSL